MMRICAPSDIPNAASNLNSFLKKNHHGSMEWMAERIVVCLSQPLWTRYKRAQGQPLLSACYMSTVSTDLHPLFRFARR